MSIDKEDIISITLYKLLKDTIDIFDKNNIIYFADGGTFLGAIRHQGIIPWDDDLDVGILDGSLNTIFKEIKNQLKKKGYGIIKQDFGFKIYPINGDKIKINKWEKHYNEIKKQYDSISRSDLYKIASKTYEKNNKEEYHKYRYPFLDLFEYVKRDNLLITKGDESWWSNSCYYYIKNLNKLKDTRFSNYYVKTMPDFKRYFNSCYGPDWNIYGYTSAWNHQTESHSKKSDRIKIKLNKKLRQPKFPFYEG